MFFHLHFFRLHFINKSKGCDKVYNSVSQIHVVINIACCIPTNTECSPNVPIWLFFGNQIRMGTF